MIANKTISLIIPCKNEAVAIKVALEHVPEGIDEIIVIDNGSTDKTKAVAKELGAKVFSEPRHVNGIGYGFALARGIREATSDIIICMDGDGSYPTRLIPSLITYIQKNNIDFLSCNRIPFQHPQKMSSVRKTGVIILNLWIRILYGYHIRDSLSGMWVIKKHSIEKLQVFEGGWNFSLEIKINALKNKNIRFAEYHIPYHDRQFDSSKQNIFKTGIEHFFFLLKIKFFPKKYLLSIRENNNLLPGSFTYE